MLLIALFEINKSYLYTHTAQVFSQNIDEVEYLVKD